MIFIKFLRTAAQLIDACCMSMHWRLTRILATGLNEPFPIGRERERDRVDYDRHLLSAGSAITATCLILFSKWKLRLQFSRLEFVCSAQSARPMAGHGHTCRMCVCVSMLAPIKCGTNRFSTMKCIKCKNLNTFHKIIDAHECIREILFLWTRFFSIYPWKRKFPAIQFFLFTILKLKFFLLDSYWINARFQPIYLRSHRNRMTKSIYYRRWIATRLNRDNTKKGMWKTSPVERTSIFLCFPSLWLFSTFYSNSHLCPISVCIFNENRMLKFDTLTISISE